MFSIVGTLHIADTTPTIEILSFSFLTKIRILLLLQLKINFESEQRRNVALKGKLENVNVISHEIELLNWI